MPKSIETARKLFSLPPVWRRRLSILGIILASLFTAYTLAGFFLAPYLFSRYVPRYAEEQLHAQLQLGQVRINPLLFTCEIKELRLQLDEETPIFSVQRLFVDFEMESLFRRAWTFADLAIESPDLYLDFGTDGRLNLEKLIAGLPQSEPPPETEKKALPRLLFKHLILSGGTVQVDDHSKPTPATATFTPIVFEFNDISTLPEHCGTYAVSAAFPDNGGTIDWKGEMSLQPISANGAIELKDFKPATIWRLFQDGLNLDVPAGTVQLAAEYHFSSSNGESAFALNPITLTVNDLSLSPRGAGQPLLKLKSLTTSNGQIDFATRKMVFPSIILKDGQLAALVDKAGVGNWEGLGKKSTQSQAEIAPGSNAKTAAHEAPPWQIAVQSLEATGMDLHYSDASGDTPINLETDLALSLNEASVNLGRQEALIKRVALTGGGITFSQSAPTPDTSAEHKKNQAKPEKIPPPTEAGSPEKPWKFALNQFSVSGFHLGFVDQRHKPPLAYDLSDLRAEVKDFASPGEKPVSFEVQTEIRQGGSASLNGTLSQANGQIGKIEARITVDQLDLKPLAALVAKHAALTLVSGNLSTNLHLLYAPDATKPSLAVNGEATIGKLLLNEEGTSARLLAWKELTASGLDFGLNPDRLNIERIRLREPGLKVTIFKDKSLNLAKLGKQPEKEAEETEKPPFPVVVEGVRLDNGVVDFADLSLVLPFATRIEQCKGGITGISTKRASRASLKFEGKVGEFGQAKAKGSLIPSNPKQFTDIKVTFRNVAMPPLSPYTATFAGRTITSGKLNLDLGYDIKDSELVGENSVVLEDFTLGDRVESPGAMNLPLDLAIALLTDSEGKIDIAMPIRGNVDHPEFSYGHLIRQALFNLLSKIVTAPFRALGAVFGGSSENPGTILFEPGRAELAPPEQEKLKNIAEALGKRDQLQLTVHGGFEPGLDGTAIKRSQLRRTLVQKFGTKRGPMAFDNAKTQRALEKMADDKLAAFQSRYEETTGKKVNRVNPALALLGKASEDSDFYRALFDHLVETAPLPQAELETLAAQRGTAIVQELTSRFKGDPARISIGDAVQTEEQEENVPAKLELSVR